MKKWIGVLALVVVFDICLGAGLFCMVLDRMQAGAPDGSSGYRQGVSQVSAGEKAGGEAGDRLEPKVEAMTFDDGPDSRYTEMLLNGLEDRGVKASFFLVGESIEGNEALVKRMAEDGHLVGVHCLHHRDLTREELSEANRQLEETRELIRSVTGRSPEYIRPPYGKWNEALRDHVTMVPVFWSVDSLDWKLQNSDKILRRVVSDTKNGDIILMHDEFQTSVDAALGIIDNLMAKGYTFVTVDELSID